MKPTRWPDVPRDLRADWENTNHFELTSAESRGEYWFFVWPISPPDSQTDIGKRAGQILEMAAEAPRLADEVARLREDVRKRDALIALHDERLKERT